VADSGEIHYSCLPLNTLSRCYFLMPYRLQVFVSFLTSLAKFSSACALAILIPCLQVQMASLYSSQVTHPCFQSLYVPFLPPSLPSRSLLSHAGFLPCLPAFLFRRMESSCDLRKAPLKSSQFSSASLSLRTAS